jgi:hypothetical protein
LWSRSLVNLLSRSRKLVVCPSSWNRKNSETEILSRSRPWSQLYRFACAQKSWRSPMEKEGRGRISALSIYEVAWDPALGDLGWAFFASRSIAYRSQKVCLSIQIFVPTKHSSLTSDLRRGAIARLVLRAWETSALRST